MTTTSSSLRCRKFCSVSACGLPAKDSALDYSPRPAAPACTSTARTVSLDLCAWLSPESIALNAQPQLAAACGRLERSEGNHGPGNLYARHSMDRALAVSRRAGLSAIGKVLALPCCSTSLLQRYPAVQVLSRISSYRRPVQVSVSVTPVSASSKHATTLGRNCGGAVHLERSAGSP